MRGELERFEREKVEDFKSGVETFLEGAVEAQKEVCYHLQFQGVSDGGCEGALLTIPSLSNYGRPTSSNSTQTKMVHH